MPQPVSEFGLGAPYHVGCVAISIEQTCARLGAVTGGDWTAPQERLLDARTPAGRGRFRLRWVYSRRPPHLEIIEALPGTLWDVGADFALHHLGFWTTDLVADHARLRRRGYECVYAGAADGSDEVVRGAYFRVPHGPLVEIVDVALRPAFEDALREGT